MTKASVQRAGGRRPDELRPVRIEPHPLDFAEGSTLISFGRTRVLCAASAEAGVPRFLEGHGMGWVTAEYSMLPRSTHTRTPREAKLGRLQGRTQEIQRLIGRSLRTAVRLDELGEVTITVDCDVLQADGGTRTAAITGGYVALALAVRNLIPAASSRILTPVAAVSVGIRGGVPLLDLDYSEDSTADVDLNVVRMREGRYVEVQATGERTTYDRTQLGAMLDLADAGVDQLLDLQAEALAAD